MTDLDTVTEIHIDGSAHSALEVEWRPDNQIVFANIAHHGTKLLSRQFILMFFGPRNGSPMATNVVHVVLVVGVLVVIRFSIP